MLTEKTQEITENQEPVLQSFESSRDKTETELSDNGYTNSVLEKLDAARKDGSFCDITLLIGRQKQPIKAHRVILASASDYFRAMFSTDFKEGKQSKVELPTTDIATMNSLVDFVYTGKIKVNNNNIEQIVTAANYYGMAAVLQKCLEYLMGKINKTNSIEMLEFAERISDDTFKNFAVKFVVQNFESIYGTNLDIMKMTTKILMDIIRSPATVIHSDPTENEERLFQLGWNHLQAQSNGYLERALPVLLRSVHLPRVSDQFLQDLERKVENGEVVNEMIKEAKDIKDTIATNTAAKQSDMTKKVQVRAWVMYRFRKTGVLSDTCHGLKNEPSLSWFGIPAYINGSPLCICARVITINTPNSPPVNYLVASVTYCQGNISEPIPCKIQFTLIAPKKIPKQQDLTIGEIRYTFKDSDKTTRSVPILNVGEVLSHYYDHEKDSCTLTAQITMESDDLIC